MPLAMRRDDGVIVRPGTSPVYKSAAQNAALRAECGQVQYPAGPAYYATCDRAFAGGNA
jgi:hypothetical protein